MKNRLFHFNTVALHGAQTLDLDRYSRAVPVYRTTSYQFKDTDHAKALFDLQESGHIYTRLGNPTLDILEQRMAMLEGGKAGLALASGTSAIFYTVITICQQGDEIIASKYLYGGTATMFRDILPRFGIKVHLIDIDNTEEIEACINEHTRLLYTEVIGNPILHIPDFESLSAIARQHHIPLAVDSTFATPWLCRPIEYGADIVIHSLTKWLGGHGTAIGGIVIDAGTFDWSDPKFKLFNEPDPGYHDMKFATDLGEANQIAFILRMRLVALRNLGACISPDNAWMFLQGIETLSLRMDRHCSNALQAAKYLEQHPKVQWVTYPGLSSHKNYDRAQKYLDKGHGGVIVFGVKEGLEGGKKVINNLKLISHVANVGDAKSLMIHPASTTHGQLSAEQLKQSGITPDMLRFSIGIEDFDDIKNDLNQALDCI